MHERINSVTPYTAWTASPHHGGLLKTMAEVQADQERVRRNLAYRSNFALKDTLVHSR